MILVTLGGGSTRGRRPVGHLAVGMAGQVDTRGKTVQTAGCGYGRMESGSKPVGPGEVRGNDLTRAAWGTQLDPMDLAWRRCSFDSTYFISFIHRRKKKKTTLLM